jgi:hypothetical protein
MQKKQNMEFGNKAPCHDAFRKGQDTRRASPLPSGVYKLREVLHRFRRDVKTMETIHDYLLHPGRFRPGASLGCCTTDDKSTYLKGIPKRISGRFGKDVLPAIKALVEDGVPLRDVMVELDATKHSTVHLLGQLETQHTRLQAGIASEYRSIKTGYSELCGLLNDAKSIVKSALGLLEWHKEKTSRS